MKRSFGVALFCLVLLATVAVAIDAKAANAVIDFEGLAVGQTVDQVSLGSGISGDPIAGEVLVTGNRPNPQPTHPNFAITFDSTCGGGAPADCSGGDPDLFNPALGNLLIIAENKDDANGDGLVDDPDDADIEGAFHTFDFSGFGPDGRVNVESITVIDFEGNEDDGGIELFRDGVLVASLPMAKPGDGETETILIGVDNIDFMRVIHPGSGGIDNVEISIDDQTPVGPICDDPARIIFRSTIDQFRVHGRVKTAGMFDATSEAVQFILSNADGVIYSGQMDPGDCVPRGDNPLKCVYKDRDAKHGLAAIDGISKFTLKPRKNGFVAFRLAVFEDFSAATLANMRFEIRMGDQRFAQEGPWQAQKNGWKLSFQRLPECR